MGGACGNVPEGSTGGFLGVGPRLFFFLLPTYLLALLDASLIVSLKVG